MACASTPDRHSQELRRWLLQTPRLLLMVRVLLLAALLHSVALAQWTTQLRRSCSANSASALCCTDSCGDDPQSRAKLAGVVSAFRQSEALAAERGVNLTASVERYRALTVRGELAAGAARNACEALVLEIRASVDAVAAGARATDDRLAANVSDAFRRATDERAALGRRMDGADDRLRAHSANLSSIELSLKDTRRELNATIGGVSAAKSEITRNLSSLVGALEAVRSSMNDKLNATSNQTARIIAVVNQHSTAIGYLNRTQQQSDNSWKRQVLNVNTEMNLLSSKVIMVAALSRFIEQQMRFSTRILLSTVTALCSLNKDLMSTLPQCQGLNSFASNITAYINDVSSEMRTIRQQVASSDTAFLTATQEDLRRRSTLIQSELDTFYANISKQARNMSAECKAPWVLYLTSCYLFGKQLLSQTQSNEICMRFGGHLVLVNSKPEHNFLRDAMVHYGIEKAWIGLIRHASENSFVWSTGESSSYTAWIPGEPTFSNNNERCTEMLRIASEDDCRYFRHNVQQSQCQSNIQNSLNWNDVQCSNFLAFICERHL